MVNILVIIGQLTNNVGMKLIDESSASKLKLSSKRLKSGKVQVKFHFTSTQSRKQYGYLLTNPETSLKEVVSKIIDSYNFGIAIGNQRHLYCIGRQKQATEMLLFN